MWKKIKPYVISVLIALAVGGISALITRESMDIYTEIAKPKLAPPGFIFPIVWGILYTLMGISSALVYIKSKESAITPQTGLGIYALQLAVNFFWPILFFTFQAFFNFLFVACTLVDSDTHYDSQILQDISPCRLSADTIPCMGNICRVS